MTTNDFDRLLEDACRRARGHLDSARHRPPRSQASAAALRAAFKVLLAENGEVSSASSSPPIT
jgi:hypothetical protein